MKTSIERNNILRDCLHNMSARSGATDLYCKGMLVGVVGALAAFGWEPDEALKYYKENFPADCRPWESFFPPTWDQSR